ncbi:MAG: DUF5678 domain-containing protein [bacterium]
MVQRTFSNLPKSPSKEYWDDLEWLNKHYSDLRNQYPDQWVAVVNQKVVSSGTNLAQIETEAKTKTGRKEFPVFLIEKELRIYAY